jgi:HEAT repeat protein
MDDVRTYAARRLQAIKREPTTWANADTWRREYAAADSAELQSEVLGLAKQIGSEAFLAVLSDALASRDRLVRLDAVRSLAFLHENERVTGVTIAIAAADSEVRAEVMEVIQQMPAPMQTQLLRETLGATYPDVQKRSVELLAERPSPAAFSVLIDGLRTSEPGALALINEAIEGIVEQHFDNYTQANRWWAANRDRYDGMMLLAR